VADLERRIKLSFDECRLMLLVIQVFLGFQFRAPFEPRFAGLPPASRLFETFSLVTLLAAFAMLVAPATLSDLAFPGENSSAVDSFTTAMIDVSLIAFAVATTLMLFVTVHTVEGTALSGAASIVLLGIALALWYGVALMQRTRPPSRQTMTRRASLEDETEHVLTEARMIVPGAAALIGFQFATVLMESFGGLEIGLKRLHLLSTALIALSIIFLIAPAAYHRVAAHGEESQRVVRFGRRAILASLLPLVFGIAIDTFVVMRVAATGVVAATLVPAVLVIVALALWFGYPLLVRRQRAR
jgi:hypothetical protein